MTWTAKLNIDSINHRLIEYPDWKGPTKIIKAQLLPWPLSNAMEYKDHTSTLVWQESRMGQLSVLWNTTTFFPWMPSASWMDSANMGSQLCYSACPDRADHSLGASRNSSYTSAVPCLRLHIHPHTPCKAVCLRQVPVGIAMLWTSGLWNHSTDRGVANSNKRQQCVAVLTAPAIEKDTCNGQSWWTTS